MGKTKWGGTISCAVLEYFSGLPWTGIANGPSGDTLENQYVSVSTASVDFLFNSICRRIVGDIAVKLHDTVINHTQLCPGL